MSACNICDQKIKNTHFNKNILKEKADPRHCMTSSSDELHLPCDSLSPPPRVLTNTFNQNFCHRRRHSKFRGIHNSPSQTKPINTGTREGEQGNFRGFTVYFTDFSLNIVVLLT